MELIFGTLTDTIRSYLRVQKVDDKIKALKDKAKIDVPDHLPDIEQPAATKE